MYVIFRSVEWNKFIFHSKYIREMDFEMLSAKHDWRHKSSGFESYKVISCLFWPFESWPTEL